MADRYLLENGTDKLLMEDGSFLLIEGAESVTGTGDGTGAGAQAAQSASGVGIGGIATGGGAGRRRIGARRPVEDLARIEEEELLLLVA